MGEENWYKAVAKKASGEGNGSTVEAEKWHFTCW